jgi:hypothetical protein
MKNWILNLVTTAGLLLAFVLTMTPPSARLAAGASPAPQERREKVEDMHRAEQMLRDARAVLAGAPGEYAGHRDRAIKHVDAALGEVHEAIEVVEHH